MSILCHTLFVIRRLSRLRRSTRPRRTLPQLEELEGRAVPTLMGNQLFPADNPWNEKVANAPVAANSATLVASIGLNTHLHADFGTTWAGALNGIPYNVVSGTQPAVNVVIDAYPDESDLLPVPIPANAVIEGDPLPSAQNTGDRHMIVYDQDHNIVYELYNAHRPSEEPDNQWHADSEAVWNLNQDSFRTPGFTSADAAGLPILPGLVRPDEVLTQGVITHALRFTVPQSDSAYVFPASHEAGVNNANLPRMGERFRLKQSVDISQFPADDRVILQALKDYGMIVADNGSPWFLSGAPSSSWSDNDLAMLSSLHGSDFEAVDLTPVVSSVSPTSGPAAGGATVLINGLDFSGGAGLTHVSFGGVDAGPVQVLSDTQIRATAPALPAGGVVDVTVVSPYGTSVKTAADRFTYATTQPSPITGLTLSNASVTEFRPTGTAVGAFTTAEAGSGHVFTYTLVSGAGSADNASFAVNSGQLVTADAFDYAARSSYSVRVRTTDENGQFIEQTFMIAVVDDPELSRTGRTLVVSGIAGADAFTFAAGAVRHALSLNGVSLAVDAASVDVVVFQGGGGVDTATLTGGGGPNTLTLAPGGGTLSGPGYAVSVSAVKTVVAIDHAGNSDAASLYDAAGGANSFTATTANSYFSGAGFFNEAVGFHTVVAYAAAGNQDLATLFDSPGDDSFTGTPTAAYLSGTGFFNEAVGFPVVVANAVAGGHDTAALFDAPGANTFIGTPTQGYFYGSGYFNEANGFKTVVANAAAGGSDTATLFDAEGANSFVGRPAYSYLTGAGYLNEAVGFKAVAAYAVAGGNDSASLYGSGGADIFTGSYATSSLSGSGFVNTVIGFQTVAASEGSGNKAAAYLYDSPGNDALTGQGAMAVLSGPGYAVNLSGFYAVAASATAGGVDHFNLGSVDYLFTSLGRWQ